MLIIPAIDLKDGCVVRFTQGRLNKKVYSRDPVKTAKHWARQGAQLIHVVDLDGALSGEPKNLGIAKEIAASVDVPVQFGGGARSLKTIKELLDSGIRRVVLGTKAAEDRLFLKKAVKEFKDKVIVSVDARGASVMTKGWASKSGAGDVTAFITSLKGAGFRQIIFTDVSRDGTLSGPSIKYIKKLLQDTGIKIIASGGISSLDDIYRLKLLEKQGVTGVIIGKALYEGRFTLPQALKLA